MAHAHTHRLERWLEKHWLEIHTRFRFEHESINFLFLGKSYFDLWKKVSLNRFEFECTSMMLLKQSFILIFVLINGRGWIFEMRYGKKVQKRRFIRKSRYLYFSVYYRYIYISVYVYNYVTYGEEF